MGGCWDFSITILFLFFIYISLAEQSLHFLTILVLFSQLVEEFLDFFLLIHNDVVEWLENVEDIEKSLYCVLVDDNRWGHVVFLLVMESEDEE